MARMKVTDGWERASVTLPPTLTARARRVQQAEAARGERVSLSDLLRDGLHREVERSERRLGIVAE